MERLNSRPGTVERPSILEDGPGTSGRHWIVTVYDNDYNTVDQVIAVLMLATQCARDEAVMETWEIHNLGRSVVHHGAEDECQRVSEIIAKIGIRVEVSAE